MNHILEAQNAPEAIELMKARQEVYARATRMQVTQLLCTVLLPFAFAVAGIVNESVRSYVAFAAFALTLIDIALLDPRQRRLLRLAARISEQFDCNVLKLPWNKFVAGRQVDPEISAEAAGRWHGNEDKIRDWYPAVVGGAPLHLARLICQRTNLWYDSSLRRKWGSIVRTLAVALVIILIAAGFWRDLSMTAFAITILAPATPPLTWAFREHYRQKDAADAIETIKGEAEALWDQAKGGSVDPETCLTRSREFQNAIFARRSLNPLVFPFTYALLRGRMEMQMNRGAAAYLSEIGG
jgi:hypothetical protein